MGEYVEKVLSEDVDIIENSSGRVLSSSKNSSLDVDVYKDEYVKKSNVFISSKYNSTLLENKILALAFNKKDRYMSPDNTYRISIYASEVCMMSTGKNKEKNIYRQLAKAADSLVGHKLYFMDMENHRFKITTLVHTATYENGILTLEFPETIVKLIDSEEFGFTKLPLAVLFRFSSVQSFRIYEHLKSRAYLLNRKDTEEIYVRMGLSELKINCACIDTDEEAVKKELQSEHPDFDKIVNEIAKTNLYPEWRDFRRIVLEKAKKEINEVSDLLIDYEAVKVRSGGKVVEVIFTVKKNKNYKEKTINDMTFEELDNELENENKQIFEVINYFKERTDNKAIIKTTNVKKFLKIAKNDVDYIKETFELSRKQTYIEDIIGWMVAALKEGYAREKKEEARSVKAFGITDTAEKREEMSKKVWERYSETKKELMEEFIRYSENLFGEELFNAMTYDEKLTQFFDYEKSKKENIVF